jgi:hypothetical protein
MGSPGVDIGRRLAAWVFTAHAYAFLMPLALVVVAARHQAYLESVTDFPALVPVAAAILSAGSAFEITQNAIDRWYIAPGTGSAGEPAVWDFLFSFCITAGQALIAVAIAGQQPWVLAVALLAGCAQPVCYARRAAVFAPLATSGLLATVVAFQAFGDPVVFLQLLMVGVTLYFFTALLRTGAQVLHGFTTAAAASGLWFLVLAIDHGARGEAAATGTLAAVAGATLVAGLAARRRLLRLPPTRRVS